MSTLTVFADAADGLIYSSNATYATARSGGALTLSTADVFVYVGQQPTYNVFEGFESFDTSALTADATVSAAVLSLYGHTDASATDFTINCRLYDWGATLTTADWIAGASLSGQTLLAHFATSGYSTAGYNVFTDDAFAANVNKTGFTRIILDSERTESNTTPTGNELVAHWSANQAGTTNDPKLVITYTTLTTVDPAALSLAIANLAPARFDQDASPGVRALTIAAMAPQADQETTPPAIELTVAAVAPDVEQALQPAAIALTLTPEAPVRIDLEVTPDGQGLTLTPIAPIRLDQDAAIVAIALTLDTPPPALDLAGAGLEVNPDALVLAIAAESPGSVDQAVIPDAQGIVLDVGVPQLDLSLLPASVSLILTAEAPASIDEQVLADAIALALAAAAPALDVAFALLPDPLGIVLGAPVPTITLAIVASTGAIRLVSVPIGMSTVRAMSSGLLRLTKPE